jgi:hypothetical protein
MSKSSSYDVSVLQKLSISAADGSELLFLKATFKAHKGFNRDFEQYTRFETERELIRR